MLRLKEVRKNARKTQQEVADFIGISQNNYSYWENGKVKIDNESLNKLAEYFDVSVDYLLGRDSAPQIDNIYSPEAIITFPVIGEIKAGYDGAVEEYNTGEIITIPIEMLKGRPASDYFVLKVKGNSMYPRLLEDDKVLVLRTESVDSGTIAVIIYNSDEATIKKVVHAPGEDWLDLVPINPEYVTKHIVGSELKQCRVLGKAVKLIRDI